MCHCSYTKERAFFAPTVLSLPGKLIQSEVNNNFKLAVRRRRVAGVDTLRDGFRCQQPHYETSLF
jgi:hypothetical protein